MARHEGPSEAPVRQPKKVPPLLILLGRIAHLATAPATALSNSEVVYRKHVVNSSAKEYERQRQIRSSVRKVTGAGGNAA